MRGNAERFYSLFEPVLKGLGYELWGVEFRQQARSALLRVYIDQEQGVTLDDCSRASQQLSGLLEVEDIIATAYTLEVSSPGMDRLLMKPEHFRAVIGTPVKVRLKYLVEGRRRLAGLLLESDDTAIVVEEEGSLPLRVPMDAIESARLDPKI